MNTDPQSAPWTIKSRVLTSIVVGGVLGKEVSNLSSVMCPALKTIMCELYLCGPLTTSSPAKADSGEFTRVCGCSQVCSYRCIVSHESQLLEDFSLCILQKHNCLGKSADIPALPDPPPMGSFRGQALSHDLAEALFIGWLGEAHFLHPSMLLQTLSKP